MLSRRPPKEKRTFHSPVIEQVILDTTPKIADPLLAHLFQNCFPNTLDTTVFHTPPNTTNTTNSSSEDTFIITGDIDAMWLRDSTNQVFPYIQFAPHCEKLRSLLRGLIRRQAHCVLLDPYANAFYHSPTRESQWKSDLTPMLPGVHERKYELDSLASVLRLLNAYIAATNDTTILDDLVLRAIEKILDTITYEQQSQLEQPYPTDTKGYRFQRTTPNTTDSLPLEGLGNPYQRTGLSRSPFRPSDDSTIFQYLIPANAQAAVELAKLPTLLQNLSPSQLPITNSQLPILASRAKSLANEISSAIHHHAIIPHPTHGPIFAYEIDGFGSHLLMDDAGPPNLISLPYLGFCNTDNEIYQNTRRFALSPANPYFASGPAGSGLTSPHIGLSWIWPLGLITQAITSTNDEEILQCLRTLRNSEANTGFIHESFRADSPQKYTRDWFAWANSFFAELLLHLLQTRPNLLARPLP